MGKQVVKYVLIFVSSVIILFMLLVTSEWIPKSAMKNNMESSAEYMCRYPKTNGTINTAYWEHVPASFRDQYADSISLGIAWQSDPDHPFSSAMRSSYYFYNDEYYVNRSLKKAIEEDETANNEYIRYWHGNTVFIRLFHLFTDVQGMYIFHAVLLGGLFLCLLVLLWKMDLRAASISLLVAGGLAGIWFVPMTLEYTWIIIITLIVSPVALIFAKQGRWNRIGALFLVTGILTNYFDFLTTETLTLLIPLLLLIACYTKENKNQSFDHHKPPVRQTILFSVLWGIGYLGMWVMKWVIASIILGENVMPYITGHISQRLGVGESSDGTIPGAIMRNVRSLFPTCFGMIGILASIFLITILLCAWWIYRKEKIRTGYCLLYAALGALPYIRFMVMCDHSYRHYFFAYRAQVATILALGLITGEIIDGKHFRKDTEESTDALDHHAVSE